MNVFAGILFPRVVLRNRYHELALLFLNHTQQVGCEAREGKYVCFFGHVLNVVVFHHGFIFDGAAHIEVQTIPVLYRAFHGLPDGLLLLDTFDHAVNVLIDYFRGI